jgi:phage terminase small subunit
MAKRVPAQNNPADLTQAATDRHWRMRFLDHLAESSNVTRSAEHAGIEVSRVYRLRRAQPDFARQWQTALCEGYSHLEMEVLRRLREGDFKTDDGDKFDFANAIRLLAAHRETAVSAQNRGRDVSAAEVRASIDRKIEEIRRRVAKERANEASGG